MVKEERLINPSRTIKRNLALLASTQALLTIVVQTFVVHVPITITAIGGSTTLAGLGTALMWGGRLATTYKMGSLMDRVGRMPVIMSGMALMASTAAAAAISTVQTLMAAYLAVLIVFGVGRGMADYSRIAAGDMLPQERRGLGTGVLLSGSLVGTLAATPVVATVYAWAGEGNLAAIYYAVIPFALAGFVAAFAVRPDPLEIGRRYVERRDVDIGQSTHGARSMRVLMTPAMVFAYVSSAISTGVMVAFMSLGSLILHMHHVNIAVISLVVTIHVIGMYAFSIPLGKASDILGRVPVTAAGVVVCAVGAFISAVGVSLTVVTIGMFLIGVGWSAATVGSIALISDETEPSVRGKALGFNDTAIAFASLATPLIASAVLEKLGAVALGLTGLASAIPTLFLIIGLRRRA
jgi:MFS family permease